MKDDGEVTQVAGRHGLGAGRFGGACLHVRRSLDQSDEIASEQIGTIEPESPYAGTTRTQAFAREGC